MAGATRSIQTPSQAKCPRANERIPSRTSKGNRCSDRADQKTCRIRGIAALSDGQGDSRSLGMRAAVRCGGIEWPWTRRLSGGGRLLVSIVHQFGSKASVGPAVDRSHPVRKSGVRRINAHLVAVSPGLNGKSPNRIGAGNGNVSDGRLEIVTGSHRYSFDKMRGRQIINRRDLAISAAIKQTLTCRSGVDIPAGS